MKKPQISTSTRTQALALASLERLYPWLLLATILWLTWMLAKAFWLVLAPPTAPALTPLPLQPAATIQAMNGNALDIFAQPAMPSQAQAAPPPDIKVVGVTVASPAQLSYAIINANGKTQSYKVNDLIEGSPYKLVAVQRDHVMIASANGQTTKISFGQPFSLDQSAAIRAKMQVNLDGSQAMGANPSNPNPTGAPMAAAPAVAGMDNNAMTNPANPMANTGANTATPNASNAPNDSGDGGAKSAIGGAIDGLQQNPAGYLSQMGVAATGQGYLVTDGMPAGLKNKLGLETGDKVLSVNGQSIGQNPSQDAQILQQVQQAGQAQIQVQRGDQVVTVRQSF